MESCSVVSVTPGISCVPSGALTVGGGCVGVELMSSHERQSVPLSARLSYRLPYGFSGRQSAACLLCLAPAWRPALMLAILRRGRRVLAILHNAQPCSAMALAQRSAITQVASRGQAGGARHRSTTAYEIDPRRVTITQGADGVAEVRLSRPDKMNALDLPMFRSIAAAARRLIADPSVRAVVLHGEGRAFCAGLDVNSVAGSLQAQANLKELLDRPEGEISK